MFQLKHITLEQRRFNTLHSPKAVAYPHDPAIPYQLTLCRDSAWMLALLDSLINPTMGVRSEGDLQQRRPSAMTLTLGSLTH